MSDVSARVSQLARNRSPGSSNSRRSTRNGTPIFKMKTHNQDKEDKGFGVKMNISELNFTLLNNLQKTSYRNLTTSHQL